MFPCLLDTDKCPSTNRPNTMSSTTEIQTIQASRLWTRLAETTRPLQPAGLDRRAALDLVVRAVEVARDAGITSTEMSHVRGLALHALSAGSRDAELSAMARIYSTSILERAKLAR